MGTWGITAMTIIIMAGNNDYVLQFSDRRLSSPRGIVEESSNKAIAFACTNGRFAVGYTGLARSGRFDLQAWLVEALERCASPEFTVYETAVRVQDDLTELFRSHPDIRNLSPVTRRLTIMFSGYLSRPSGARIGNLWITNFQDFDAFADHREALPEFSIYVELQPDEETGATSYIQRVGAWSAMSERDMQILRDLLERSAPLQNIIDAGVAIVRRVSESSKACGTVGKEVAVTIVPRDWSAQMTTRIRIDSGRNEIRLVDMVSAFPGHTSSARDVKLAITQPDPITKAFQPKLGRNDRCWCKSGKKFKQCHGR